MFACQEAKKDDSKTTQTEQVEKFTPETFSETDIPENIKKQEKAKIIGGVKWKDKQGSFLLILVEIPLFKKPSKSSSLFI